MYIEITFYGHGGKKRHVVRPHNLYSCYIHAALPLVNMRKRQKEISQNKEEAQNSLSQLNRLVAPSTSIVTFTERLLRSCLFEEIFKTTVMLSPLL